MRTFSLILLTAAACSAAVTPPEQIQVPPGFKVELLREAGPREGSWICMTQDEQGRLYISPQGAIPESGFGQDSKWGGIWRVTLAPDAAGEAQGSKLKAQDPQPTTGTQPGEILNPKSQILNWERVPVPVGDAMGMLWAFDSLYVSGMGPQGRGIYRCTSSKRDGNLDTATLFKAIPGGAGEHGAHAIVLGPDKKLYIVNGNSTGILDGLAPDSPYRHWGEDDLLPRLKDPVATFFDKLKAPYGCVYRTDADGTKWELFAGGFRNPYDIAFNPDGELFTYDSDMEWDRGLPWYRPTRLLHVVPGGEYGFREGSAKWPAYFPDSLPAVADIGVGCPTGMKFGTEAKGWPEKYRRALFLHDWTYGRILAVTLHEKGASYTARNDLASYTYPRDAEANGDVEVFLSGKGMPVTDLEFLRDGSMVFTVGGRGTAAALYRVSWMGEAAMLKEMEKRIAEFDAKAKQLAEDLKKKQPNAAPARKLTDDEFEVEIARINAANREIEQGIAALLAKLKSAPEAQRKLAGGVASEASATTGSPPTNASAPEGAQLSVAARLRLTAEKLTAPAVDFRNISNADFELYTESLWSWADKKDPYLLHWKMFGWQQGWRPNEDPFIGVFGGSFFDMPRETVLPCLLQIARLASPDLQEKILEGLQHYSFDSLPDNFKLLKLRILELSFARQGRPSEERVKAVMEELLAHYPVPPIPANAATPARNPAAGAPVDAPAWRLNRELCALLTWLSNPDIGALNADLAKADGAAKPGEPAKTPAPAPSKGKTGDFRPYFDKSPFSNGLPTSKSSFFEKKNSFPGAKSPIVGAKSLIAGPKSSLAGQETSLLAAEGPLPAESKPLPAQSGPLLGQEALLFAAESPLPGQSEAIAGAVEAVAAEAGAIAAAVEAPATEVEAISKAVGPVAAPLAAVPSPVDALPSEASPLLAQTAPVAGKTDTLPTEAPPAIAKPLNSQPSTLNTAPNSGLGPVPNPGADIFPGRKGAAFHAELGRQVIEKTLALMDAAPSQEEQVWYALCLRWAHGWTPELRVRYFRWFHEKAARYSGGNSFAKFVEAIRADAASRVTWAESALLAEWMHPVAAPQPAAALKPRAFVKAWTLPELEAALDKLKDRPPDLARGKDLYTQAQCAQCHLFRDAGGNVGPDLTAVAQRFGRHDILESITDPSKVVSEQYAMVTLTVLDGKGGTREVSGLVKDESSATITILTDPLAGTTANLYKNVVVKREKAAVSIMPPGLLYTLTAEEVADLLALFGAK